MCGDSLVTMLTMELVLSDRWKNKQQNRIDRVRCSSDTRGTMVTLGLQDAAVGGTGVDVCAQCLPLTFRCATCHAICVARVNHVWERLTSNRLTLDA